MAGKQTPRQKMIGIMYLVLTCLLALNVSKDVIREITVTDHSDDRKWYNRAVSIIDDMLNSQSTDVDLVGGATYSSEGIRDAVINLQFFVISAYIQPEMQNKVLHLRAKAF